MSGPAKGSSTGVGARVAGAGRPCRRRVALRLEQPLDALDDDAGLACARAGDDDQRPVAPFDDSALGFGESGRGRGPGVGHRSCFARVQFRYSPGRQTHPMWPGRVSRIRTTSRSCRRAHRPGGPSARSPRPRRGCGHTRHRAAARRRRHRAHRPGRRGAASHSGGSPASLAQETRCTSACTTRSSRMSAAPVMRSVSKRTSMPSPTAGDSSAPSCASLTRPSMRPSASRSG